MDNQLIHVQFFMIQPHQESGMEHTFAKPPVFHTASSWKRCHFYLPLNFGDGLLNKPPIRDIHGYPT